MIQSNEYCTRHQYKSIEEHKEITVFEDWGSREFLCIFWVLYFLKNVKHDSFVCTDLYSDFHHIFVGTFFTSSKLFYRFTTAHSLLTHQDILYGQPHAFFLTTNSLQTPFHHSNNIYHIHFSYLPNICRHTFSHLSIDKLLLRPSYYFSIALYRFFHHSGSIIHSLQSFHGPIHPDNRIHRPRYSSLPLLSVHSQNFPYIYFHPPSSIIRFLMVHRFPILLHKILLIFFDTSPYLQPYYLSSHLRKNHRLDVQIYQIRQLYFIATSLHRWPHWARSEHRSLLSFYL